MQATRIVVSARAEARFWSHVDRKGPQDCWPWTGSKTRKNYGRIMVDAVRVSAHRVAWYVANGPIPDGMVVDHLCHGWDPTCMAGDNCPHRACVNPAHMELVTSVENTLRGRGGKDQSARTHCVHGHEFTPENTYRVPSDGSRECYICRRARREASRRRVLARQLA